MISPTYCYTIRFLGSADPQRRYQLQISEVSQDGKLHYRAQWDFLTLRSVLIFLKKHFPDSQAILSTAESNSLAFENVLTAVGQTRGMHCTSLQV